jgi:uncharacterized membrane protein
MKHTITILVTILTLISIALALPTQAFAQEEAPVTQPDLSLSTTFPSQVVELGESITIKLKLQTIGESQTLQMEMDEIPEGWTATFRGGGRIIHSVFVDGDSSETIDLRLDPPENPESGELSFVVLAQGDKRKAELPLTFSIQEKVPAGLSFATDLPVIKGSPTTTFRYTTKLENTGDEDLTVNLQADAPSGFLTKFKVSGQDVTSFSLGANQTKTINVELDPIIEMAAGTYYFTIYSSGSDLQASLDLAAEVTGQQELSVTSLDGRLSSEANAGKDTPMQILVRNTGTAAAQGVEMSADAPSGWTVSFDPEVIAEIPAGSQAEVTAHLTPAEKAVAGDYMVTLRAKPIDGVRESADFRITVRTSTMWGIVGIGLIAVAVGVVALAVMRFGRR